MDSPRALAQDLRYESARVVFVRRLRVALEPLDVNIDGERARASARALRARRTRRDGSIGEPPRPPHRMTLASAGPPPASISGAGSAASSSASSST